MAQYLIANNKGEDSILRQAYEHEVPIFVPAFSDCSAGFGLVMHQEQHPHQHVHIDSVKDFRELTQIENPLQRNWLIDDGRWRPQKFCARYRGRGRNVAGRRRHAQIRHPSNGSRRARRRLSGSTLKEACSWGKVDTTYEQMVFCEATIAFPLLAAYAYHKGAWKNRQARRCATFF